MCSFKKELTNDEKVLKCLGNETDSRVISKNKVNLNKYDLTIGFKIIRIQKFEKIAMVEIAFTIYHEQLLEPVMEIIAGVKDNVDDAIEQCVKSLFCTVLNVLIRAINSESEEELKGIFSEEEKRYNLTKGNILNIGERENSEEIDFWNLLGEKIIKRLGNKKIYLIKVYGSKIKNGDLNCECSINGVLDKDITNHINEYAKSWSILTNFFSSKQFFVIKQNNETYEKYPYNQEQVVELVGKVVKILANCDSEEKYNNIDEEVYKVVQNKNTAYEMRCFIPEIFCEFVFREVNYSNKVIVIKGEQEARVYKSQFTIYNWVYEYIRNIYNQKVLNEEELKRIVTLSSSYRAIADAIDSGEEIENLNNIIYGICGPEGYKPL